MNEVGTAQAALSRRVTRSLIFLAGGRFCCDRGFYSIFLPPRHGASHEFRDCSIVLRPR